MPRININEKDYTSPGASLDYANFSVLVLGFEGAEPNEGVAKHAKSMRVQKYKATDDGEVVYNRPVAPDDFGVYEFTSSTDFEKTIGLCKPECLTGGGDVKTYHYGNQMAYELLKLGYTVIYKPIKSVAELTDARTWEIFKDKSKYDFRFIVHGLLCSDSNYENFINSVEARAKKELINAANNYFVNIAYKNHLKISRNGVLSNITADEVTDDIAIMRSNIDLEKISTAESLELADVTANLEERFTNLMANDDSALLAFVSSNPKEGSGKTTKYYDNFVECWNVLGERLNTAYATLSNSISSTTIADANTCIAKLAAYKSSDSDEDLADDKYGRGDCIALIELDEHTYDKTATTNRRPEDLIIDGINSSAIGTIDPTTGAYCALTVPSVYYKSISTDKSNVWGGNNKFPGSFHYLACFMNSLKLGYKEWYAAAGYTRGVSSHTVDHTEVSLGEVAVNALEPRYKVGGKGPNFACNVIAKFRGSYYLWGNRTAYPLGEKGNIKNGDLTASSFLNIRQLCTSIKKQLYVACRQFTFDPNSDTLWFNFVNAIKPTLEVMKADQGIRDYKIIKVKTDTKATLKARIRIIPIEAVEDFTLEVSLEDSFGETAATVIG